LLRRSKKLLTIMHMAMPVIIKKAGSGEEGLNPLANQEC
jgi:hypothetical protein